MPRTPPPGPKYTLRYTDPNNLPAERACRTCKVTKPLTEEFFYRHTGGGFRHECKACRGIAAVLLRYGVTREQYAQMLADQGGGCKICGEQDRGKRSGYTLSVDHCHGTNRIRGLLCAPCNLAIGYLRDSPELCRSAAEYLEETAAAEDLPVVPAGSVLAKSVGVDALPPEEGVDLSVDPVV